MRTSVHRVAPGDELHWSKVVGKVISSEERDGQLISGAEATAALSDDRCCLLIAEFDEESVGVLAAYRFPDVEAGGAPLVYLYDVEVLESYRRYGIGKALINYLVKLCETVEYKWDLAG